MQRFRSAVEAAIEVGSPLCQVDGKLFQRVSELAVRRVVRGTCTALRKGAQFIGNVFDHRP